MQVVTGSRSYRNVTISGNAQVLLGDQHVTPATNTDRERAAMLQALSYPAMNSKRAQLFLVGSPNLEWIWDTEDNARFQSWLEDVSDLGMFWISGKPASGKSTMIKYLSGHSEVIQRLERLTGSEWLILYFFFDFRSGDSTANNLDGLSRVLLFQLVQRSPEIAKVVAQTSAGDIMVSTTMNDADRNTCMNIDATELLISSVTAADLRICAFIDGLDEYEGNPRDLVMLLKALQSAGIKLCVSSRPEPELRHAFRDCPQFQMHEHNLQTIQKIVETTIEDIPDHPAYIPDVVETVVRHAEGVVLWACFAADELRTALLSFDDAAVVRARLEKFPKSLEAVYARILSKLSLRYEAEVALLVWLVTEALPHYDDKAAQIWCTMSAFQQRGWLPSSPYDNLTLQSFCLRVQACFGQLILLCSNTSSGAPVRVLNERNINDPKILENTTLRVLHKTLRTYLHQTSWLRRRLPNSLETLYPNLVWLRLKTELVLQGFDTDLWMMFTSLVHRLLHITHNDAKEFESLKLSGTLYSDVLKCFIKFVRFSCRNLQPLATTRSVPLSLTKRRDLAWRLYCFCSALGMPAAFFEPLKTGHLFSALTEEHGAVHGVLTKIMEYEDTDDALYRSGTFHYVDTPTTRYVFDPSDDDFFCFSISSRREITLQMHLEMWQSYVMKAPPAFHKVQLIFTASVFAVQRTRPAYSDWLVAMLEHSLEIEVYSSSSSATWLIMSDYGMPVVIVTGHTILVDTRIPALISCTGGMLPELLLMLGRNSRIKQQSIVAQPKKNKPVGLGAEIRVSTIQSKTSIMRQVLERRHRLPHFQNFSLG